MRPTFMRVVPQTGLAGSVRHPTVEERWEPHPTHAPAGQCFARILVIDGSIIFDVAIPDISPEKGQAAEGLPDKHVECLPNLSSAAVWGTTHRLLKVELPFSWFTTFHALHVLVFGTAI